MKVNIASLDDLLDNNLSVEERGILITILLLKDKDPSITLAKTKTKLSIRKHKFALISLHKNGFITWSGYERAKKSLASSMNNPRVVEVISFMNSVWGTDYKATSKTTTENLRKRLDEYSVDDCKLVVANRYKEWKDDPLMSKYLTPHTIFRPSKFEKYFQEAKKTQSGKSLVEEGVGRLTPGERITYSASKRLSDSEIYNVRVYSLSEGKRIGSGQDKKITGKNLKLALKILSKQNQKTAEYIYQR